MRVILFPSIHHLCASVVAGVPDESNDDEVQAAANAAVIEFTEADAAWCKTIGKPDELDKPEFEAFLRKHGFIVFDETIIGPQWD